MNPEISIAMVTRIKPLKPVSLNRAPPGIEKNRPADVMKFCTAK
jgi:hypothetical protein